MNGEKRTEAESDGPTGGMPRRGALRFLGVAGFAGVSSATASAKGADGNGGGNGNGPDASAEINVLTNPNFITDAAGETAPFAPATELFDPGPVSIPLDEIIEGSDEYDSTLGRPLNDGKHQVVRPPEGYDRDAGYDEPWVPVTWGEYSDVGGTATVGGVKPAGSSNGNGKGGATGTRVNINVRGALPNGQYTIWVVKFAALADDSELGPEDPFVTPAGNGLVGFHNLGQKSGDDGDSENDFVVDESGDGGIRVFNEGGALTGIPGFEEPGYPFVGEADDYEQSASRLSEVANDLREEDEIHFVGAFHYDDQVWGVYPGPWHVNHFSAVFRF
jgi:hypothetical protein